MHLQQSVGNYATQRLIGSSYVQTKLQISTPGDRFEREADHVADSVMRMSIPSGEEGKATATEEQGLHSTITPLQNPTPDASQENDELETEGTVVRAPLAVREDQEEEKVSSKLDETGSINDEFETEGTVLRAPLAVRENEEEDKVSPQLDETGSMPAVQREAEVNQLDQTNHDVQLKVSPEGSPQIRTTGTVQLKCEGEACDEDHAASEEQAPPIQRETLPVSEDEEEKVAIQVDAAPLESKVTQVEVEASPDTPVRRQSRDEEELESESAVAVQREVVETENVQRETTFNDSLTPLQNNSAVQRSCTNCEDEKEKESQPEKAVQREAIPTAVNLPESQPDAPIQRQTRGDDEKLEGAEPESTPIQRQIEDEDEKEQKPFVQRSIWSSNHFNISNVVHRICAECQSDKDKQAQLIHRQSSAVHTPPPVNAKVTSAIQSLDGAGRPLPLNSRAFFEPRFGVDFGHVRIHTDTRAIETAHSINARAFTFGRHIAFGAGEYSPDTDAGKHVLAHELTHVVQQTGASEPEQSAASPKEVHRLPDSEQLQRGIDVYDLLDGWTSSQDSADILGKFAGLPKTDVNAILNAAALHASMSVFEIYKWLHSDMVTSDWKALLRTFITVKAVDIAKLIAFVVVTDDLEGWTSEEDSKEALEYLSSPGGSLLDEIVVAMEGQAGKSFPDMATYLFGELTDPDALALSLSFLGSGSIKAIEYAVYWHADKIRNLIEGYTSIRDSASIVQNFQRIGGKGKQADVASQIAVLTKLNELSLKQWNQTAEDALMEDMQQDDYNTLQKMLPRNLRPYDLQKNFFEQGWDKIVTGFDYVEGWIEYGVCGIVGILFGVFDAIASIVSGVVDIGYAVKNICGWLISVASGGRFGRESSENVHKFFNSLGQALGAPLDMLGKMWDATVEEASLTEGPFEECKLAIFWVRRLANIVINVLLLIFAGYGAVKAALEALEAIKNISSFAEFLAKLGKLPMALLRKLKTLPAKLAGVGEVILNAIRNVDSIAAAVRKTIGLIRLAAKDPDFFINLRKASGDFVEGKLQAEKDWWAKRKEVWTTTAETEEAKIAKSEELVNTATGEADTNPTAAEQKATQAEDQAVDARQKTGNTQEEINTGKTAEERTAKQPPGVTTPETEAWEKSLSPDTLQTLKDDPELYKFWREMDPEVRRALTFCNTPCIPLQANEWPEVLQQIKSLQQRLKTPGDHIGLREYLHIYRNDRKAMSDAIKAVDTLNSLKEFEAFLDDELIKAMKALKGVTVRKDANGLWEFVRSDGKIVKEFKIGSHSELTSTGSESFFQSHHGIQNEWAKRRFAGLGVYNENEAQALLLRTRNLEGGARGTPHGLINGLQGERKPSINTRTFAEELKALKSDLDIIGAPPSVKTDYIAAVEKCFKGLHDTLAGKLSPDELKAIFGDWPK
jgi:Domain of unknown function (DUF4157)/HNH/Endo VII superfamily toxin with a SHH signature